MRVDTGRLRVVAQNVAAAEALAESLPDDEAAHLRSRDPARDDDLPSPGAYIEEQRVRRGISIEQLAVLTKIPKRSLEFLEADRFEQLPGQLFVKGFLRCCARAMGVSQQAVMDLLHDRERAVLQARRKDRNPEPVPPPERPLTARERTGPRRGVRPASSPSSLAGPAAKTAMISRSAPPQLRSGQRRGGNAVSAVGLGAWERVRRMVPSAHAVLWIVVALFVAFLVLAAFNLAGAPGGVPHS